MKHSLTAIFSAAIFISAILPSNNCEKYLQFREGITITTTNYDAKDKVTGSSKQTVTKVTIMPTGVKANIKMESFDKNGKPLDKEAKPEFSITCSGGTILMDIKMLMPSEGMMGQTNNMQMKMEGENMEYPATLSVGQKLKDAKMKISFTTEGMPMTMDMNFNIVNRKVEAKENITTPAGIYECFKISYETESVTGMMGQNMTTIMKAVQWYNVEAGDVKTANYNGDGKLLSYTLLTAITK